jgi:predicted RND superfamily exporter protein
MDSNTVFWFAMGFLLGLVCGVVVILLILPAAMLSSRISQADERKQEEAKAHE